MRLSIALRVQQETVVRQGRQGERQQHDDHSVEAPAAGARRAVRMIEIGLALQAIRRQLEHPGEREHRDQSRPEQAHKNAFHRRA